MERDPRRDDHQRVEAFDGSVAADQAPQVKGRTHRGCHAQTRQGHHLVRRQSISAGQNPMRPTGIRPDELDRHTVLDPFGTVHGRRGESRNHTFAIRPQPRRCRPLLKGQCQIRVSVDAGEHRSVVASQLMFRDRRGGERLTSDEGHTLDVHHSTVQRISRRDHGESAICGWIAICGWRGQLGKPVRQRERAFRVGG